MTDTGPLFVSSGDLIADRRYKAAIDLASRGDFLAAADILAQAIELTPNFATAWFALGAIRDRLGDHSGAIAAFERYGKGRKHRASLNFGDCLSYACAKARGAKLLFKGEDLAHTDVARA